jgi:hypothetical protein
MAAFGVESIEPKPSSASDKQEVANDGNDDDHERERVLRDGGGAEGTAVRHELRVFSRELRNRSNQKFLSIITNLLAAMIHQRVIRRPDGP